MKEKLLEDFEAQINALIQNHKETVSMPSIRSSLSGVRDRFGAARDEMAAIDAEAVKIANSVLASCEEKIPGLKEELVSIGQVKIRSYIMSLFPDSWKGQS